MGQWRDASNSPLCKHTNKWHRCAAAIVQHDAQCERAWRAHKQGKRLTCAAAIVQHDAQCERGELGSQVSKLCHAFVRVMTAHALLIFDSLIFSIN